MVAEPEEEWVDEEQEAANALENVPEVIKYAQIQGYHKGYDLARFIKNYIDYRESQELEVVWTTD